MYIYIFVYQAVIYIYFLRASVFVLLFIFKKIFCDFIARGLGQIDQIDLLASYAVQKRV